MLPIPQTGPCASYDKDKLMNEASFTEGAMRLGHRTREAVVGT